MSLPEFFAACDGYLERKGGKAGGSKMTKADLDAAMAGVDEEGNLLALSGGRPAPADPPEGMPEWGPDAGA